MGTLRFLIVLAFASGIWGCGSQPATDVGDGAAKSDAEKATAESSASGSKYDCEKFSMTVAKGWAASPLNMGMVNVLPEGKMSPGLYFKFEGDGNAVGTADESIESMIKQYQGSPMETANIGGVEFKSTTYTSSGSPQTMYVTFRNGNKITITVEGDKAKDDPDIQAMLAGVSFK